MHCGDCYCTVNMWSPLSQISVRWSAGGDLSQATATNTISSTMTPLTLSLHTIDHAPGYKHPIDI
jgi:hypothetical protein